MNVEELNKAKNLVVEMRRLSTDIHHLKRDDIVYVELNATVQGGHGLIVEGRYSDNLAKAIAESTVIHLEARQAAIEAELLELGVEA